MAEPVTLIVSIDTEEDNWAPVRENITVENLREMPRLDRMLASIGIRATYFATYHVAKVDWCAEILRGLAATGNSEIGAHLHPWNTPPISSALTARSTMLVNLPQSEQEAKIRVLTAALTDALGERPYVFRAGRWGFDSVTAAAILACGYEVDSSVTPYKSWSDDFGPSHVGAPLDVYRTDGETDHRIPTQDGRLIEVPVSRGYSQRSWNAVRKINEVLDRPSLHGRGLLDMAARLHIINHVVLSPELEQVNHMRKLVVRLLDRGVKHLHLTFHSSSFLPGSTPFTRTAADVEALRDRIARIIDHIASMTPLRFATVGEAASLLAPPRTAIAEEPAR